MSVLKIPFFTWKDGLTLHCKKERANEERQFNSINKGEGSCMNPKKEEIKHV